ACVRAARSRSLCLRTSPYCDSAGAARDLQTYAIATRLLRTIQRLVRCPDDLIRRCVLGVGTRNANRDGHRENHVDPALAAMHFSFLDVAWAIVAAHRHAV